MHLRIHFVDLTSDGSFAKVDFLVEVDAGGNQTGLNSPHLTSTQILVSKGQLNRI